MYPKLIKFYVIGMKLLYIRKKMISKNGIFVVCLLYPCSFRSCSIGILHYVTKNDPI